MYNIKGVEQLIKILQYVRRQDCKALSYTETWEEINDNKHNRITAALCLDIKLQTCDMLIAAC